MLNRFNRILIFAVALFVAGCSASDPVTPPLAMGDSVTVAFMATTDLHGWVLPFDYSTDQPEERYGLAKVATLVDSVRRQHEFTMLLDAGDWIQGNQFAEYFSTVAEDAPSYPLLDAMAKMKFDAAVLGNHEFNFGVPYLDKRISQTTVPILAANAYRAGTNDPYYRPYIIQNVGGVQVGVVGLTTPGSAVWDRPRVSGIIDFADGVEAAERFVAEVREAGAEFVVLLMHSAIESRSSYDIEGVAMENFGRAAIESVPGINLAITGHSHRVVDDQTITGPDGNEVPVVQAGRWGSHLGVVEFVLTRNEDLTISAVSSNTTVHSVEHTEASQAIVDLASDAHERVREHVNFSVATTPDSWSARTARIEDSPIIDLIHVVQLHVTGAQLSAAAAFNTGAQFGPGAVTRRDLAQIYPFENMLYKMEITGQQLRDFLEHTSQYFEGAENGAPVINRSWAGFNFDTIAGADYQINLSKPVGQRIENLTYEGNPVRNDAVFTIAVNSYRAEGGGGFSMLYDAEVVWESDKSVRAYMEEYLLEIGAISHSDVFVKNWSLTY
ncbi:MAG: 5'-nucleotidase C-terminal domain-containing protein [Balneolales bacterium]|nr:5'-nucleotidase C-terminal domain-containing protein [Balneolales bacterium]